MKHEGFSPANNYTPNEDNYNPDEPWGSSRTPNSASNEDNYNPDESWDSLNAINNAALAENRRIREQAPEPSVEPLEQVAQEAPEESPEQAPQEPAQVTEKLSDSPESRERLIAESEMESRIDDCLEEIHDLRNNYLKNPKNPNYRLGSIAAAEMHLLEDASQLESQLEGIYVDVLGKDYNEDSGADADRFTAALMAFLEPLQKGMEHVSVGATQTANSSEGGIDKDCHYIVINFIQHKCNNLVAIPIEDEASIVTMSSPNLGPWQETILAAGAGDEKALKWVNRARQSNDGANADLEKALKGGLDLAKQQVEAVRANTLLDSAAQDAEIAEIVTYLSSGPNSGDGSGNGLGFNSKRIAKYLQLGDSVQDRLPVLSEVTSNREGATPEEITVDRGADWQQQPAEAQNETA